MELEPRTSAPSHATGAVEFVDLSQLADDTTFRLREEGDVTMLASSMGRLGQLVPLELRPLPPDPVAPDAPPRYQLLAGFRRAAALRLLRRERALARVHEELSDDDAWALALTQALLSEPLDRPSAEALGARLRLSGVAPWAAELVEEAVVRAPVEPALRERFLEFLGLPEAPGAAPAGPSDDAGLDGEPITGDEGYLAALDGAPAGGVPAVPAEGRPEAAASPAEEGAVEVTPEELASDLAVRLYESNQDLSVALESWADLPPAGRREIVEQVRWMAGLLQRLEEGQEEER